MDPYVYQTGTPVVVDGDTVKVDLDLGFHLIHHVSVRLAGINAPEISTDAGKISRLALLDQISALTASGGQWLARTYKSGEDKYGRYLAVIVFRDADSLVELSLNQWLVTNGYAKEWDGQGPKPV